MLPYLKILSLSNSYFLKSNVKNVLYKSLEFKMYFII